MGISGLLCLEGLENSRTGLFNPILDVNNMTKAMNSPTEISLESCLALVRDIPDFPKPGIMFKDITPLLGNGPCLRFLIDSLAEWCEHKRLYPDLVAGPEARGFILGAALAYRLGVGFVPIRKPHKLPHHTVRADYGLEYGSDSVEMHIDAIAPGQGVIMVDDLLATGGTMSACAQLMEGNGARVLACLFLMELRALKGRQPLAAYPTHTLLTID